VEVEEVEGEEVVEDTLMTMEDSEVSVDHEVGHLGSGVAERVLWAQICVEDLEGLDLDLDHEVSSVYRHNKMGCQGEHYLQK
jgi:hypothetical protein